MACSVGLPHSFALDYSQGCHPQRINQRKIVQDLPLRKIRMDWLEPGERFKYCQKAIDDVASQYKPPAGHAPLNPNDVLIFITIARNGTLRGVEVIKVEDDATIDTAVVNSIVRAIKSTKFAPLPDGFPDDWKLKLDVENFNRAHGTLHATGNQKEQSPELGVVRGMAVTDKSGKQLFAAPAQNQQAKRTHSRRAEVDKQSPDTGTKQSPD